MDLPPSEFAALVDEALRLIPEEFAPHLENVQFFIEEEPDEELRERLGMPWNRTLLGLYSGTPMIRRPYDFTGFPDCITLYRRPLLDACRSPEDLRRQVVRTVLHEVAHHFGIGEERLRELGYG